MAKTIIGEPRPSTPQDIVEKSLMRNIIYDLERENAKLRAKLQDAQDTAEAKLINRVYLSERREAYLSNLFDKIVSECSEGLEEFTRSSCPYCSAEERLNAILKILGG